MVKIKVEWSKDEILHLLETNDKMVIRSIVKIFEKQTEDEQQTASTNHNNGVGYNGVDAEFMSSLAKQIQAGKKLSDKQMVHARKKIKKYAKQLTRIANNEL